jgi:hypothetical protein
MRSVGILVATSTTYIGDMVVSLLGVTLLRDQSRARGPFSDKAVDCSKVKCPRMAADAGILLVFIYYNLGWNSLMLLYLFLSRYTKGYVWGMIFFTWFIAIGSWAVSLSFWKDFLDSTRSLEDGVDNMDSLKFL